MGTVKLAVFLLAAYFLNFSSAISVNVRCGLNSEGQISCGCSQDSRNVLRNGADVLRDVTKQMENTTESKFAKEIIISNCPTAKVTVDLSRLLGNMFSNVKKVVFENSSPMFFRFSGDILSGDMVVEFRNIHGFDDFFYGLKGSVVLQGGVDFCQRSCQTHQSDQTGPPSLRQTCNDCIPSNIRFNFVDVEHVLLKSFGIASYDLYNDEGHTILSGSGISTFRVDDPLLNNVVVDRLNAKECWLNSNKVDCDYYGKKDSNELGVGLIALIVICVLLPSICCLVFVCFLKNRKQEQESVTVQEVMPLK